MSESTIVRSIIREVRRAYPKAYVRKLSDRFTRGLPDILIVLPWITLFVETKTKKGKPSTIQLHEAKSIKNAGGIIMIATDPKDVMEVIRTWSDFRGNHAIYDAAVKKLHKEISDLESTMT